MHALSDWGATVEKMISSPRGTDEEEEAVRHAGRECEKFIKERWTEREWETAWFVNPAVSLPCGIYASKYTYALYLSLETAKRAWPGAYTRLCSA